MSDSEQSNIKDGQKGFRYRRISKEILIILLVILLDATYNIDYELELYLLRIYM